jgi:hypothetical protein
MRKTVIRRDPIFHETPHQYASIFDSRRSPTLRSVGQTRIKVGLIWFPRMKFESLLLQRRDILGAVTSPPIVPAAAGTPTIKVPLELKFLASVGERTYVPLITLMHEGAKDGVPGANIL